MFLLQPAVFLRKMIKCCSSDRAFNPPPPRRVDTEEWMATVEVLLSKSREACQWMVQYLVGPEGREITRSVIKYERVLLKLNYLFLVERAAEWNQRVTKKWPLI